MLEWKFHSGVNWTEAYPVGVLVGPILQVNARRVVGPRGEGQITGLSVVREMSDVDLARGRHDDLGVPADRPIILHDDVAVEHANEVRMDAGKSLKLKMKV